MSSGTGTGMDNSIAKNQEQEGNKKHFQNSRTYKFIPEFQEWKRLKKADFFSLGFLTLVR